MPKNDAVAVGVHFAEFIERQVSQGRYGSATDVGQAGLRLLEERETGSTASASCTKAWILGAIFGADL
jgi:putative addiction module CopG family antidote